MRRCKKVDPSFRHTKERCWNAHVQVSCSSRLQRREKMVAAEVSHAQRSTHRFEERCDDDVTTTAANGRLWMDSTCPYSRSYILKKPSFVQLGTAKLFQQERCAYSFHLSWRVATCETVSTRTVRFAHVRKNCDARRRSDLGKGRLAHKDETTPGYVKKVVGKESNVDEPMRIAKVSRRMTTNHRCIALSVQRDTSTREVKSSFTHESRVHLPDTTEIASTNDKQRMEEGLAKQRRMELKTVEKLQFLNHSKVYYWNHGSSFNSVYPVSRPSLSASFECHTSHGAENLHLSMWNRRVQSYRHALKCCHVPSLRNSRSWIRDKKVPTTVVWKLHMQILH